MAKASTLIMQVAITGDGINETYGVAATIGVTNANAPGGVPSAVILGIGDNTLAPPGGAATTSIGALIVPPSNSVNTKKLKGAGADTGITISPSNPVFIPTLGSSTTIIINSAGTETISVAWL